jgi:nicotinate-nucleotide adenylyltransferase
MAGIAILGGSFDPIHCAHLTLAECARDQMDLESVLFVPARQNPHKPSQPVASDADRLRMIELAVEGRPGLQASAVEMEREGPSYTLLTVRELREALPPEVPLFLLLGSDSVRDLATWWHADELVAEAAIVPFDRPGCPLDSILVGLVGRFGEEWVERVRARTVDAPLMDVSSTAIRKRIGAGLSIEGLVPEAVARHISAHRLYAGK